MATTKELAKLEEELEVMARQFVEEAGGYRPFGGTLDRTGQLSLTADQGGAYQESFDRLLAELRAQAASAAICAAGVATMGRVNDSAGKLSTAIVVSVHHRSGKCVDFVLPFTKGASGGVTYGEPQVGLGKTKFF